MKYSFAVITTLLICLLLTGCSTSTTIQQEINSPFLTEKIDPYAHLFDTSFVINIAGFDVNYHADEFGLIAASDAPLFAQADALLIHARLTNNSEAVCRASKLFEQIESDSVYEQAIVFETIASLNCHPEARSYYFKASALWDALDVEWRSKLTSALGKGGVVNVAKRSRPMTEKNITHRSDVKKVIIGQTKIEVTEQDNVVYQVDRTHRDWLGLQMHQSPFDADQYLRVFSERLSWNSEDLMESVGWHEGARLQEIQDATGAKAIPAVGTIAGLAKDGNWYATDHEGIFRYKVPLDKILYPTNRFLRDNLVMIIDTHGANMMVAQAVVFNASIVLTDCDLLSKVQAARDLSSMGIRTICIPDRFAYNAIGHNVHFTAGAPFSIKPSSEGRMLVSGGRRLELDPEEPIAVLNASMQPYGLMYYRAPYQYFSAINKTVPLKMGILTVSKFSQVNEIYTKADQHNMDIVASRTYFPEDYKAAKTWLDSDPKNKLILFHSASYPAGQMLFNEYPDRVFSGDPNPIFLS